MVKKTLKKWLGIEDISREIIEMELMRKNQYAELTSISADVSITGQSNIVIVSRIGGGRVHIVNAHFSGLREIEEFIKYCQARFGATKNVIDAPRNSPDLRY